MPADYNPLYCTYCTVLIPSSNVHVTTRDTHRTHHNAERHDQTFCHCGLGATPGALRLVPRGQVELDLGDRLARVEVLPQRQAARMGRGARSEGCRAGEGGVGVAGARARTFGQVLLQFMMV